MENKFPKNVRQIGNVSDTPKIYVEDYVDTFLNQICDKADKEQAGAFLVGKKEVTEGQECLYIFGAICMEFSDDENEIISQENFEKAEQKKTSRLTYVASVFLVIVVLIMGVTTLNNYGKMKSVQSSLEFIRNSIMKQGEEKTQKTSGTVKEANEQQNENTVQSEQTNDPQTEEQQDPMPQQGEGSDSASTEEEKVDDSSMSTMQEMSEDIYIVEKGDTLAKISKKVYGDSGHVDAICRMNGLSDGNLIFIGQKLILP